MSSDSYFNHGLISGGVVVTQPPIDEEDVINYTKALESLSLAEFIELTDRYNLKKKFDTGKTRIRQKLIMEYKAVWTWYVYRSNLTDIVHKNILLDSKTQDYLINNITDIQFDAQGNQYKRLGVLYGLFLNNVFTGVFKNDYICTVFSLKRSGVPGLVNYAYLYSVPHDHISSSRSEVVHKYICYGPNLLSSDGEYRPYFTSIYTLDYIELHYRELMDEVEEYLQKKSKIKYYRQYYTSVSGGIDINLLTKDIDNRRYAIKLFTISWLMNGYLSLHKIQTRNTTKDYQLLMYDNADEVFMQYILDVYTIDVLKRVYAIASLYVYQKHPAHRLDTPNWLDASIRLGQKIIPMGKDIENIDIQNVVWREIYVNSLCNDLIVNHVCPGLSLMYDWIIINGVDNYIFNNPEVIQKMILSDEEKIQSFVDKTKLGLFSPSRTTSIKKHNSAILVVSEYVGRPINDIKHLKKSKEYQKSVRDIFDDKKVFHKYMFDISYSLLCIHCKLNIIHGDLHLNNTTIHHTTKSYLQQTKTDIKRKTTYVVDDTVYEFEDYGFHGSIIDFGRSFILSSNINIQEEQNERILQYYNAILPEFFKKNKTVIAKKLEDDFLSIYKKFASVDMFIHTDRLLKFIKINNIITHKDNLKLVEAMHNLAKKHLTTIDNKSEYKCKEFLKFFPPKKIKGRVLNNIYCFNADLVYSLNSYDKLPVVLKHIRMKKPNESTIIDMPIHNENRQKKLRDQYREKLSYRFVV